MLFELCLYLIFIKVRGKKYGFSNHVLSLRGLYLVFYYQKFKDIRGTILVVMEL